MSFEASEGFKAKPIRGVKNAVELAGELEWLKLRVLAAVPGQWEAKGK